MSVETFWIDKNLAQKLGHLPTKVKVLSNQIPEIRVAARSYFHHTLLLEIYCSPSVKAK